MRPILGILLAVFLTGCSYYTERFSYANFKPALVPESTKDVYIPPESLESPDVPFITEGTSTNQPAVYSVRVFYITFLQWGKAAHLETKTRTRDFSRSVNGEGLETGVETEAIKAITEGITQGVVQGLKGGL